MSTLSAPPDAAVPVGEFPIPRHPLGLPAGSVRAILALLVFGLIWALLLIPGQRRIPLYLYYLMFLILGHYFAVRGHSPRLRGTGQHPPLYLPRGSIRFILLAGSAAVIGYGLYRYPDFLDRMIPAVVEQPLLLPVVIGAFFVGVLVAWFGRHLLLRPGGVPPWFQDCLAWVSLIGVIGLTAELLIRLVINPTLEPGKELHLPHWEGFLAAVVAFYFGARS